MLPIISFFDALKPLKPLNIAAICFCIPFILGCLLLIVSSLLGKLFIRSYSRYKKEIFYTLYTYTKKLYGVSRYFAGFEWDKLFGFSMTSILCDVIAFSILLTNIICYQTEIKPDYKNYVDMYQNVSIYITNWESMDRLSKLDIEAAEEFNQKIKNCIYYTEDWKNDDSHYVDTEYMWAKFCNNIEARRVEDIVR